MIYGSTVTKATRANPSETAKTTKVFYVILGTLVDLYLDIYGGFTLLDSAMRFSTMGQALAHINDTDDLGPIQIQRVTETMTPGETTKRILRLNDIAPEGEELEFVVFNGYFADGDVNGACELGDVHRYSNVGLNEAHLFKSEMAAVTKIREAKGAHGMVVRRVITNSTKPVVTTSVETVK